ncbi:hypothetical protein BDV39DRAFT_183172 [Aspergillus sergii]|uniref:Uncharacterized protein n=1 Tax=Aspergillus sergii TaxID=1034303 RepID=A0A5N6WS91_9EURO|nr:hypothetical protein BDV39DRAFT_183172 [Aspergillus sergii]
MLGKRPKNAKTQSQHSSEGVITSFHYHHHSPKCYHCAPFLSWTFLGYCFLNFHCHFYILLYLFQSFRSVRKSRWRRGPFDQVSPEGTVWYPHMTEVTSSHGDPYEDEVYIFLLFNSIPQSNPPALGQRSILCDLPR